MDTVRDTHPMDELKRRLRLILDAIPPHSDIYYIDYPVHTNGGDLLILKGSESFFKEHRIRVRARYSVFDFPDDLAIPRHCIIVLHGGGNFGDLYPAHQRLRERIVARYPRHRVVILPQTIYYKDRSNMDATAAIFNRHPDLHLFVRDTLSLDMAADRFKSCNVYLSPDMAHQLWPLSSRSRPEKELLCFYRTDIEKTAEQGRLERGDEGDVLDWPTLYNRVEKNAVRLFSELLKRGGAGQSVGQLWSKYTDYLVNKAVERFGRYRTVRTSRLHGHILSCLLDKPNVLMDNAYGKNVNYYRTWTGGIANAKLLAEPVN